MTVSWSEPRRAHPAAIAVYAWSTVTTLLSIAAPILVLSMLEADGLARIFLPIVGGGLVVAAIGATLAVSYVRWLKFQFTIDGDTFHVEQGILFRKNTRMAGERIQTIDTAANLAFRILGLVTLNVHTAGATGKPEVSIPALTIAQAEDLTQALRSLRPVTRPPFTVEGDAVASADTLSLAGGVACVAEKWTLSDRMLALNALTSTSGFGTALVGTIAGVGVIVEIYGLLVGPVDSTPPDFVLILGGLVLIVLVILVAWAVNCVLTALRYWGFSAGCGGDVIVVEHGLLRRVMRSVPLRRVQAVRYTESVPAQMVSKVAVSADCAGVMWGTEAQSGSDVLHPILEREEALRFSEAMVPGHLPPQMQPVPRSGLPLYVVFPAIAPLIVAVAAAVFLPYGWLAFLVPLLAAAWGVAMHKDAAWGFDEVTLALRWRIISRTTLVVRRSRIQSVQVTRNPIQRRMGLATVRVQIASVSRAAVAHVEESEAWRLFEWVSRKGT